MNENDLAELGLTKEDVLNRLVERLSESFINSDEEYGSDFQQRLELSIKNQVDEKLNATLTAHVLPKITTMVDEISLQETNRWGEKLGTKLTFIEYLTQRADAYIREEVNFRGKTQAEDSYSWQKSSTRIAYMIHEHLQYSISRAMESALGNVHSSVRKGLEEAVKTALAEIKVSVNTTVKT